MKLQRLCTAGCSGGSGERVGVWEQGFSKGLSWECTSESSICSLRQVLMGRNHRARILLAASSTGKVHTPTRVCLVRHNTDKHKHRRTHRQKPCSRNWKIALRMCLNVTLFLQLHPALVLDLTTSAPVAQVTLKWRRLMPLMQFYHTSKVEIAQRWQMKVCLS